MLDFLQNVDFSSYWNYDGSLTTPPCEEGIKWTIIKDVQPLSNSQLNKIKERINEPDGNNRAVQKTYRNVYYKHAANLVVSAFAFGAVLALQVL